MDRSKINILIAEDDADDAQMLVEALSETITNFEYITFPNGHECLRNLKTGNLKPDLLFLDVNMPYKTGLECLRDISKFELIPDTPIIVCSTSFNIKDIDLAYTYHARGYLIKPTTFSGLKQLVKIVFKKLGEPKKQQFDKANFVIWEKQLSYESPMFNEQQGQQDS